eukprot:403347571
MQHWNKIINAKPSIDTEIQFFVPKKIVRQRKTILLDEEKKTEIERENRILLEKITRILQNKKQNQNDASYNFTSRNTSSNMKGSLNLNKRWDDYKRIKEENQRILSRLMNQKSHFDWSKVDQQNQRHDELVSSMCNYPRILPNLNQSLSKRCISVSPVKKVFQKYVNHKTSRNPNKLMKMAENANNSLNNPLFLNNTQQSQGSVEFDSLQLQQMQQLSTHPYLSIQNQQNDYDNSSDNAIENRKSSAVVKNQIDFGERVDAQLNSNILPNIDLNIKKNKGMIQQIHRQELTQVNLEEPFRSNIRLQDASQITNQYQSQQATRSKSTLTKKATPTPLRQIEYILKSKNNNRYDQGQGRKILYQGQRQISGKTFDVEVSKTKHKVVIICLDVQQKQNQVVNLWVKQAEKLIEGMKKPKNSSKLQGIPRIVKYLRHVHGTVFLDVPKDLSFPAES